MTEIVERPAASTRHRLEVDAFYKMAEAGVLPAGCRVELIDGDIIDMTPIGSAHAGNTNRLIENFARAAAAGQALLTVQTPLRLDAYNEPQPDVMLLRPRPDHYKARHPSAADVLLVVEVSDSSLAYDRDTKLALYARFGVPEVWIVDSGGRRRVLSGSEGRRIRLPPASRRTAKPRARSGAHDRRRVPSHMI